MANNSRSNINNSLYNIQQNTESYKDYVDSLKLGVGPLDTPDINKYLNSNNFSKVSDMLSSYSSGVREHYEKTGSAINKDKLTLLNKIDLNRKIIDDARVLKAQKENEIRQEKQLLNFDQQKINLAQQEVEKNRQKIVSSSRIINQTRTEISLLTTKGRIHADNHRKITESINEFKRLEERSDSLHKHVRQYGLGRGLHNYGRSKIRSGVGGFLEGGMSGKDAASLITGGAAMFGLAVIAEKLVDALIGGVERQYHLQLSGQDLLKRTGSGLSGAAFTESLSRNSLALGFSPEEAMNSAAIMASIAGSNIKDYGASNAYALSADRAYGLKAGEFGQAYGFLARNSAFTGSENQVKELTSQLSTTFGGGKMVGLQEETLRALEQLVELSKSKNLYGVNPISLLNEMAALSSLGIKNLKGMEAAQMIGNVSNAISNPQTNFQALISYSAIGETLRQNGITPSPYTVQWMATQGAFPHMGNKDMSKDLLNNFQKIWYERLGRENFIDSQGKIHRNVAYDKITNDMKVIDDEQFQRMRSSWTQILGPDLAAVAAAHPTLFSPENLNRINRLGGATNLPSSVSSTPGAQMFMQLYAGAMTETQDTTKALALAKKNYLARFQDNPSIAKDFERIQGQSANPLVGAYQAAAQIGVTPADAERAQVQGFQNIITDLLGKIQKDVESIAHFFATFQKPSIHIPVPKLGFGAGGASGVLNMSSLFGTASIAGGPGYKIDDVFKKYGFDGLQKDQIALPQAKDKVQAIKKMIVDEAKRQGVDPAMALTIPQIEGTNYDPYAVNYNKNGTVDYGIGQVNSSNWSKYFKSKADMTNIGQQIFAFVSELKQDSANLGVQGAFYKYNSGKNPNGKLVPQAMLYSQRAFSIYQDIKKNETIDTASTVKSTYGQTGASFVHNSTTNIHVVDHLGNKINTQVARRQDTIDLSPSRDKVNSSSLVRNVFSAP